MADPLSLSDRLSLLNVTLRVVLVGKVKLLRDYVEVDWVYCMHDKEVCSAIQTPI